MEFTSIQNPGTCNGSFDNMLMQLRPGEDDDDAIEGDWNDEDDEDFDDLLDAEDDLHEIQVGDDIGEPDPEDDDHLPDDDLQ